MTKSDSETKISAICDDIKELLIHKNRKYGNSKIEISPHDRGSDNLCSNRAYDAGRK